MPYRRTKDEVDEALARHDYLRGVGGFAMQHSIVSIYSSTTVVKAPDTVIRGRWDAADDEFAGESFLLNFRTDNSRLGFQLGIGRFQEQDAILTACHSDLEEDLSRAVKLPRPRTIKTGLSATITTRRSGRQYSGDPVSLEDLGTILHLAQGNTGELPFGNPANPHGVIKLRNVGSGGGMYPVTLFVHAMKVSGLADGAYEYLPHAHSIAPLRTGDDVPEPAVLFGAPGMDVDRAGFILTYVYNLYHNSRKYGDSGAVFGLIEVGGICQNVHLARTALALAGCDQGGFDKQAIESALGLDGLTRHVVLVTVIGQEG